MASIHYQKRRYEIKAGGKTITDKSTNYVRRQVNRKAHFAKAEKHLYMSKGEALGLYCLAQLKSPISDHIYLRC